MALGWAFLSAVQLLSATGAVFGRRRATLEAQYFNLNYRLGLRNEREGLPEKRVSEQRLKSAAANVRAVGHFRLTPPFAILACFRFAPELTWGCDNSNADHVEVGALQWRAAAARALLVF